MRRRQAYLDALGLTAWVPRDAQPGHARGAPPSAVSSPDPVVPDSVQEVAPASAAASGLRAADDPAPVHLGPGQGSCLYVCGANDDFSGALASDLARVAPDAPVWGRVGDPQAEEGERLELAIAERLFTQVVIFGAAQAQLVFGGEAPEQCGPARVTVAPDLGRLARDAAARRQCWKALRDAGVAGRA